MSRYPHPSPLPAGLAAGAKDRPVILEQLVETQDESGYPIQSWTVLAPIEWMHREDIRGAERFVSQQEVATVDSVWLMGYRPDMDPELVELAKRRRLRYQDRTYDIVAGQVLGLRDGIQLLTLGELREGAA